MALIYLYPYNASVSYGTWTPTGDSTIALCIDDPAGAPDDATTYVVGSRPSGFDASMTAIITPFTTPVDSIEYVQAHIRIKGGSNDNLTSTWFPGGYSGQAVATGATNTVYTNYQSTQNTVDYVTSGPWQPSTLDTSNIYFVGYDTAAGEVFYYVTQAYIEVSAVLKPAQVEQSREVISRSYWWRRTRRGEFTLRVPWDIALAISLGDHAWVSDRAGYHDTDGGWLIKAWQRRLFYLRSLTLSQSGNYGELLLADKRPYLARYFDSGRGRVHPRSWRDGSFLISPPATTRSYTRTGDAWAVLQGTQQATIWNEDVEVMAEGGQLLEGESSNVLPYSSFGAGSGDTFTGWTKSGTGANGSAITGETDEVETFFDIESTTIAKCAKFVAGDPISGDLKMMGTASASQTADTVGSFSIWTRDASAAAPMAWSLQRGYDSKWWNDGAGTWDASQVWNDCDGATTWHRSRSSAIDVGANATTLTAVVGIPSATGTAAQVNRLGHVQWEPQPLASSPIVTAAAAVTRSAGQLLISNDSGERVWVARRGAFAARVVTEWCSADLASGDDPTVVYVEHDSDNWALVWYDVDNARWTFTVKVAGTEYSAYKAATVTCDTEILLGARWTSSDAELDLMAFTLSIFVDGVKGADVVAGAAMTEASTSDIEPGSKGGANPGNLQMRPWRVVAFVPTDAEMGGLV